MNFKDTLISAELVLETGEVPLIIGESGIGKTALAKMLFLQEKYSNTSCILLNGSQFHPSSESKIQQTIEKCLLTCLNG